MSVIKRKHFLVWQVVFLVTQRRSYEGDFMSHENRLVLWKHVVGGPPGGGGDGSSQTAHIQRMKDSLLCRDTVSVNLSEYILLVNRCLHD